MSSGSLEPPLPREQQKRRSRDRMINVLLQGIIAANPHHDPSVTMETRLARAREALLGEKPPKGRKAIQNELELFAVFEEALKVEVDNMKRFAMRVQSPETQEQWRREIDREALSARGIAKAHGPSFSRSMTTPESTEDWLRRIVTNLPVTLKDMVDLEGLIYGNSPQAQCLQRIFDDLQFLGVNCTSPIGTKGDDLTPKQD